jgi:hypothetical protein
MNRYDVFRAMNPDEQYPDTLCNVSMSEIAYDLFIPPKVGDAILEVLIQSGNFYCVERFCSPSGLRDIRSEYIEMWTADQSPVYAECEVREDISGAGIVNGYVLNMMAVNASAAKKILHLAVKGGTFTEEIDVWIVDRIGYFNFCGGFEIARMFYYTDADEKANVSDAVDSVSFSDKSKSLVERSGRKLRFRDMVNA